MTRKCGFLDCNNPSEKGKNWCQTCAERKEQKICSACRQQKPATELKLQDSFFLQKKKYEFIKALRDEVPAQFQNQIDKLLPKFKLSEAETTLVDKFEKVVLDFLAEKGGKQDHIDWFLFCSECNPEISSRVNNFLEQNPSIKEIGNRTEKEKEELEKIFKKVKEKVSKEEWEKITERAEEKFYGKAGENEDKPGDSGDKDNNDNDNKNNKSAKISQLEQEIKDLKTQIENLKKPAENSPAPDNQDKLKDLENKLREKEDELKKLRKDNNNSPPSQPSKNDNSNLVLYLSIGLGVAVVVIVLLVILLLLQKKKKKQRNKIKFLFGTEVFCNH